MGRKRLENARLRSWDEVDEALKAIGQIDREVAALEAALNERIELLKENTKQQVQPRLYEKEYLELQIKEFCEAHREDMVGKSRKLNFGTVSFRQSTRILIKGVENCLAALKERGLWQCITVKESPNKPEMQKLDDMTLAEVGARRDIRDVFGYEVDMEKVASV